MVRFMMAISSDNDMYWFKSIYDQLFATVFFPYKNGFEESPEKLLY